MTRYVPYSERVGATPPPERMQVGELSDELRRRLSNWWHRCSNRIYTHGTGYNCGYRFYDDRTHQGSQICYTEIWGRYQAEFPEDGRGFFDQCDNLFRTGSYFDVMNTLHFFLEMNFPQGYLVEQLERLLVDYNSPVTWNDKEKTLIPHSSPEEGQTIVRALASTKEGSFNGSHTHLMASIDHINCNNPADSIRESIHAVESVCRQMTGEKTLGPALSKLKKNHGLNEALKQGMDKIYGFTNTAQGIRHPILEKEEELDLNDAQFMLGACAAFCSYLINKLAPAEKQSSEP
ncbi:hypothetical protein [Emcibacter sp.]|uniref:hypothetical protein n=1 Tax=Emcibacter sp. TaxID=1979954 RepID=UPI002AA8E7CA|nr:hypothetical protein [Emcibacter sp.]